MVFSMKSTIDFIILGYLFLGKSSYEHVFTKLFTINHCGDYQPSNIPMLPSVIVYHDLPLTTILQHYVTITKTIS